MKTPLQEALDALETFDKAAQSYGRIRDQGNSYATMRAQRLYRAAKARLKQKLEQLTSGKDGE